MSPAETPSGRLARPAVGGLAAYLALLISLTWARPLWLDEVLQLLITREGDLARRLALIHLTPGAVPFGYETQHAVLALLGRSTFTARLPAELFGVLALAAILWSGREIRTRGLAVTALVWALLPLVLRYGAEARPYSESLFFSAVSTTMLFRMQRQPKARWVALYAASVLAALYTQPYSVFLQVGLVAPLALEFRTTGVRRTLALAAIALGAAAALFAPWVLWSAGQWTAYARQMGESFHLTARFPLLVAREISGGSYVCSLSLLALAAAGCCSRKLDRVAKRQLLCGAACCVVLAVAGDLVFHYFFAIRQAVFALLPLTLLAGEGWAEAGARWGVAPRAAVLLVLAGASVVKDASYFRDRSEDWEQAARQLERDSRGGCVMVPQTDSLDLYEFFAPGLQERACGPEPHGAAVFVPVSKYSSADAVRQLAESLAQKGYRQGASERSEGAIEIRRFDGR